MPPGMDVAVYCVIVEPPFDAGAVNATAAVVPSVTVTVPMFGAPGAPSGVIDDDGADATEVPAAFVAVTVNVYGVPAVSSVTVIFPEPA